MQTNNYHHQQKPFVYLWRDRLSNRYYLGYHCGKNPRYICSSKYMKKEYKARPSDFTRRTSKSRAGISYKPSKEQRQKISFWNKNAWSTGFFKDRKGSGTKKGTKFSLEHRKKISEAIKQKWALRA